jgi:hypothetical protein
MVNLLMGRKFKYRRRGQTLVEFGLVMLVLVPTVFVLALSLFSLYQSTATNQAANLLGNRLIKTGTACIDGTTSCNWINDFSDDLSKLGLTFIEGDTVAVSITKADGTVYYYDQTQPNRAPVTDYGDTVMIRVVKPVTGQFFGGTGLQPLVDSIPGSSYTWLGVAQLSKGTVSTGPSVNASFGLDYTANVQIDQPRAYWRLSEVSGPVLAEASSNQALYGTIGSDVGTGYPSLIVAGHDGAFNFSGGQNSLLSLSDTSGLDFANTNSFSLEMWFSRARTGDFTGNCLTSEEPLYTRSNTSVVLSRAANCQTDANALDALSVKLGNLQISSQPVVHQGVHHLVVTYSGAGLVGNGSVEVHLYLDGTELALRNGPYDSAHASGNLFAADLVSGWSLTGPTYWAAADAGNSPRFAGVLDELALYSKALDGDTVALHHGAGVKSNNQVVITAGHPVAFQDLTNDSPIAWSWNFNSEDSSNQANPTYTFTTLGSKTISLNVQTMGGPGTISYPGLIEVR